MWFKKKDDTPKKAAELLEQLMEAQREIDAMAKKSVEGMKRVVFQEEQVTPRPDSPFVRLHAAFYRGMEQELAALRFRVVGDFEPSGQDEKPEEKRAVYRWALSDDGQVAASWFVVPSKNPLFCLVLESWLQDGRSCTTGRGVSGAHIPTPPQYDIRKVPDRTTTDAMVRDHRAHLAGMGGAPRRVGGADELIALRRADWNATSEFRKAQGLALFEPYYRSMLGDKYEERGAPLVESIMNHPEWWTGEAHHGGGTAAVGASGVAAAERPAKVMCLASREEQTGRGLLTTLGMFMHGLAELQLREIAGNHWRAATFLTRTVARKLVEHVRDAPAVITAGQWHAGIELSLSRADITRDQLVVVRGRFPEVEGEDRGSVKLLVRLETLGRNADPDTELLRILPPAGYQGDPDEWLRGTCRALGQDAPAALPFSEFDRVMQAASARSRARLPAIRTAYRAGTPAGHGVMVKTGLPATRGGHEYVWVRVTGWPEGSVTGTLESKPVDCPAYTQGQPVSVAEADIFDFVVMSASDELLEPALTDVVAREFGAMIE